MRKIALILLLLLISINFGYTDDCTFGICNVDEGLVGDTNTDIKVSITNTVLYFLTFLSLIGITFVIKGGFQILVAGGEEEKVKNGKKTILYALLGIFIIIITYSIVNIAFSIGEGVKKINLEESIN